MDLLTLGKGKLTYTMAFVAVVFAIVDFAWANLLDKDMDVILLWAGLSVFGIRRAIK